MADVITCPHCRRQLNLPDELFGQDVQCPMCDRTFTPGGEEPRRPAPRPVAEQDDPDYPDDRPRRRPAPRRPARRRRDYDYDDEDDDYYEDRSRFRRRAYPHRGSLILTLGILSVVLSCSFILGLKLAIITLFMAGTDLRSMAEGRMDRSGEGSTRAGQVCAIIGLILSALALVFICLIGAAGHH
jgi:hypothetical protein